MQKKNFFKCKKIFLAFSLILMNVCLYAYGGMYTGEKNIRIVQSKWFDIIYPKRSEVTASVLYEKADAVYEEVTAQYNIEPQFRIPVVVVPGVQEFNAFWTAVPYNHIVLYDTGVSGSSELAVFSETLISTFRHELTHAVTYNMKSPGLFAIDKVFGDFFAPGMLTVTTGMAEGATVTSESANGEGRLNDEYAKQYVKQAKIEDKFPSYHDVSGSSDITPGGATYFFNGAFHKWLQDNYGMQAYADFWYNVVNGKHLLIKTCFKKAFGIKLKKAWELFEESYEVPEIPADPVEAGIARVFSGAETGLNTSLSAGGGKIVWMDRYGSRVFYSNQTDSSRLPVNAKKLFALSGLSDVSVSNDGRFVAASYYSGNAAFATARVKIYDFQNKSFYSVKQTGLKEAAVIPFGNEYYLVAQKYDSLRYTVSISKIKFTDNQRKISGIEPYAEISLAQEAIPFAFTYSGNVKGNEGAFAYLKKEGKIYSLCISDFNGNLLKNFEFPQGTVVHSLSYSDDKAFYFSYAQKGTLPRFGKFDAQSGRLELSEMDISGGVYEPVCVNNEIFYIGTFYRKSMLLRLNKGSNDLESGSQKSVMLAETSNASSKASLSNEKEETLYTKELPSKSFNLLPYLLRGMLIPVGTYTSDYFGANAGYSIGANSFPFGITYVTGTPWTDGGAGLFQFTAGWNLLSNSVGASVILNNGTNTNLLLYNLELKSEFDKKGWKQSGGIVSVGTKFEVGNISTVSITNSAAAYAGRQDVRLKELGTIDVYGFWKINNIGIAAPDNDTVYYELIDIVSLDYSNVKRAGSGRFEYAGFAFGISAGGRYDAVLKGPKNKYVDYAVLSSAVKIYIPKLLPVNSEFGFTYNLPVVLNFVLFPQDSIYGYACADDFSGNAFFDGKIETVLFSMAVQKALPGIEALYLNDFYINAGYACTGDAWTETRQGFQPQYLGTYFKSLLGGGKARYYDSIYLKTGIEFTPNIGMLAKPSTRMTFYTGFSWFLHGDSKKVLAENWKLLIGTDITF